MNTEVKHSAEPSEALLGRVRGLAALGEPVRLAIVDMLAEGDQSPDQLAASLGIAGNLLAHHLKVLQEAGIIRRTDSQNDRRRTYVHLDPSALTQLLPAASPMKTSRVVFVCTHNSARSILAEAMWRKVSDVPSASAGTHPAAAINPRARAAAKRAGVNIENKSPQSIEAVLRPDDVVVSVCDSVNEHLPQLDQTHIHWSIPDPSRIDTDAAFDATLNEIANRLDSLAPRVSYQRPKRRAS